MFGTISRFYDFLNHFLSLGIDRTWRRALALSVKQENGALLLDLAAGTLDVSIALRKQHPDSLVLALDFCPSMLAIGQKKCRNKGITRIVPIVADAKRVPLPDESVDAITIAFGIRNILPRSEAFYEMLRVLRPGGRVSILEFGSGKERIAYGLYNWYLNTLLPRIGHFFSRDKQAYRYLAETITAFPAADAFEAEMRAAGFVNTGYRKLTGGIVCLHTGEKIGPTTESCAQTK
ncbi:MAG: ubiquinone/menaquinone biosynthesis methyltransferase [Desulfovibrionaceae bacterium]|nr:ubiquinone/menaquinone biosynthesis methyltransferase [Desulfovibrionaceae bacterium]